MFSRGEIPLRAIATLGTVPVAEHLPTLPDDIRGFVTESVRDAPATDSEWNEFKIVSSHCGREKTAEEFETDARADLLQYRIGVEAVRAFLDGKP